MYASGNTIRKNVRTRCALVVELHTATVPREKQPVDSANPLRELPAQARRGLGAH